MTTYLQWLGYGGTALVIIAYLPQLWHLIRERCSAGLSSFAYLMWGVSALLLLIYALSLGSSVFIALQSYQLLATVSICYLSKKYEDAPCENHRPEREGKASRPREGIRLL